MTRDADLSDFKVLSCTDESRGWPRSSSEVPANLIDEYLDHAEECAYHAQLMLLEQRQTEQELRMKFRLARGLDREGRLLRGTMLAQVIADNERRLASWKKETETAFNQIALYNGGRQIASCGSFFDFSSHESVHQLDPQAGLQIRGTNRSEEEDVLLGSYALTGVRHDGEEQVLPLKNGYTVGLRVIRLDETTFAVGFRCVVTESMKKLSYMQELTACGGEVSDFEDSTEVSSRDLVDAFVRCTRAVHCTLEARTKSFFKALTEKPNIAQLGTTLLLVVLLFEGVTYLGQRASMSDQTVLEAQSLFLYSDSDLVQMLTVEKLINGSSYHGEPVHVAARGVQRRFARVRRARPESQRSLNATRLFCRGRHRCDATNAKTSVVAANIGR